MADEAGASGKKASWWITTWRTVQKLDSAAWRKTRDSAPLRTLRWIAAIAVVSIRWYLGHTPHSAVAWLPPLALVLLLLLPDAESVGLGTFTWKARREELEAQQAKADGTLRIMLVGRAAGDALTSDVRTRSEPTARADDDLRATLGLDVPSTGTGRAE